MPDLHNTALSPAEEPQSPARIEIREWKRAEEALRASEEKYRSLFNSMDEGFAVIEMIFDEAARATDFRVIESNPAQERLTGLSEAVGKRVRDLIPNIEEAWLERFGSVVRSGEAVRFEGRVAGIDRWFDVHASRIGAEGSRLLALIFNDVTERKSTEESLRASELRQAFLVRLGDALRPMSDPIRIQEVAARLLGEHLGADRARYWEVSHDLLQDYAPGVPSIDGASPFEIWGSRLRDAYSRGESVAIDDVHTHPMFAGQDLNACDAAGIAGGILIPLPKSPGRGAVLGVTSSVPRAWTQADVRLAQDVAERTWAAVERARREQSLAFLADITEQMSHLATAEEIMTTIGCRIARYLDTTTCYFTDVDDARNELTAHVGWQALQTSDLQRKYCLSDYLTTEFSDAARRGHAIVVHDTSRDPRTGASVYEELRIGAFLTVPFQRQGQLKHLLTVCNPARRLWRDDEIDLLKELAERIFPRIERARAEAALRESEARLHAVANVVPDLLWSCDANGKPEWFNERWLEYTGQKLEFALLHGGREAIHPDDREGVVRGFQAALLSGQPVRLEQRLRSAAGDYRWFLARAEPWRDAEGRIVHWFGAVTDIHEQRIALDILEERVIARTHELEALSASRQALLERLVTTEEEERQRIARELHDEMGQHLTALKIGLEAVAPAGETVDRMQAIVRELDRSVDRLTFELRPPALDDLGLEGAIGSLVEQFTLSSGVHADVHMPDVEHKRLPGSTETTLYRVLQEALTNVLKHAGATNVSVIVERTADQVQLIVEDDGRGFDVAELADGAAEGHFGVIGMRERVSLIGGTLNVESAAGRGTTVYVRVPLTHA